MNVKNNNNGKTNCSDTQNSNVSEDSVFGWLWGCLWYICVVVLYFTLMFKQCEQKKMRSHSLSDTVVDIPSFEPLIRVPAHHDSLLSDFLVSEIVDSIIFATRPELTPLSPLPPFPDSLRVPIPVKDISFTRDSENVQNTNDAKTISPDSSEESIQQNESLGLDTLEESKDKEND